MNLLHIFDAELLIDNHISRFENKDANNTYIYLTSNDIYNGERRNILRTIVPGSEEYHRLVAEVNAKQYDLLILHALNEPKINFINTIDEQAVIILWSFYGYELYDLQAIKFKMIAPITKKLVYPSQRIITEYIKEFARNAFIALGNQRDSVRKHYKSLDSMFKKIDYFFWFNKSEYDLLNGYLNHKLPAFMPQPVSRKTIQIDPVPVKSNSIFLGNSRSYYNNHLDAYKIFVTNNYKGKIQIPFNYGDESKYAQTLRKVFKDSPLDINLLEKVVPYSEYADLLNNQKAIVLPAYRQMALGNIIIALRCGVKIYLSNKNPTLPWLLGIGFHIFSIENDLTRDIQQDNMELSQAEKENNSIIFIEWMREKNDLEYLKAIKQRVRN